MREIAASELILNDQGGIYHLKLRPEDVADTIILVGDQSRVERISHYFDHIEYKGQHREFVTHTGRIGNKRISVLSTGIGVDNIDIVLNELDALVNIDLSSRTIKAEKRSLQLIRLGTSGSLQADIPVDSFVISSHGIGMDWLLQYYDVEEGIRDSEMETALNTWIPWKEGMGKAYVVQSDDTLLKHIGQDMISGMTATANGFYGPQGRVLRLKPRIAELNQLLQQFHHQGHRITNFEMETSALYGLGKALGHRCVTVCAIIANRFNMTFSKDYHLAVDKLIQKVLDRV
jgi:uridine phosphorylase